MGSKLYTLAERFPIKPGSSIVEIGSERGEGSTSFLTKVAIDNHVVFHSVDIIDRGLKDTDSFKFHHMSGESFVKSVLTSFQERVAVLYLDNFDWQWAHDKGGNAYEAQIAEYASLGLVMSNINSTLAHLKQLLAVEPYMADEALVVCDDTYFDNGLDAYVGKGAGVVYYLLARGWKKIETDAQWGVALTNR